MTKIKRYEQNNTASGDDKYSSEVILEIEYNVKQFIEAILTRSFYSNEYGYIKIDNEAQMYLSEQKIKYSNGKLTSNIAELERMPLDSKIISIGVLYTWTSTDYVLKIQK